jgi:hypothetical protein
VLTPSTTCSLVMASRQYNIHGIIETDPSVAAIHSNCEVFDGDTEVGALRSVLCTVCPALEG